MKIFPQGGTDSRRESGRAVLPVLLIAAALALAVLIAIPAVRYYAAEAGELGCASAFDAARRQLAAEYLMENGDITLEEISDRLDIAMDDWTDLCPSGGTVYLMEDDSEDTGFALICGLHDTDGRERVRLNADYLRKALAAALRSGSFDGTLRLNGRTVRPVLCSEPFYTVPLSGDIRNRRQYTVYYMTDESGVLCRFGFSDADYYAVWDIHTGWSGSAIDP